MNHFKLNMQGQKGSHIIHLYKVQFGAEVDPTDSRSVHKVFKSIKQDLANIFGIVHPCETNLLSTTMIEEEIVIPANFGGKQTEVRINHHAEIDMDDPSPQAREYLPNVLMIFNNIVKHALRQKKYEQVGRFPKFFLAEDKIEIRQH